MNELKRMNLKEWIEMNKLKWRKWNGGTEMKELKRINQNEWIEMKELK